MIKFIMMALVIAVLLYHAILLSASAVYGIAYLGRKRKHQKEWNAQKRKLELEGKTESQIREAYFEYCKKLVHTHRDGIGWGIPEIGHINQVRRDADGAEALAE